MWVSHPLSVEDVPDLLDIILREWMTDGLKSAAQANIFHNNRHQRKPRRPSLASVSRQASKAGIEVARYEIKPDGSIVVVTGEPKSTALENPWLADLTVTKQ